MGRFLFKRAVKNVLANNEDSNHISGKINKFRKLRCGFYTSLVDVVTMLPNTYTDEGITVLIATI